eukprot:364269-Chlamydomonas_euryale.AAC.10
MRWRHAASAVATAPTACRRRPSPLSAASSQRSSVRCQQQRQRERRHRQFFSGGTWTAGHRMRPESGSATNSSAGPEAGGKLVSGRTRGQHRGEAVAPGSAFGWKSSVGGRRRAAPATLRFIPRRWRSNPERGTFRSHALRTSSSWPGGGCADERLLTRKRERRPTPPNSIRVPTHIGARPSIRSASPSLQRQTWRPGRKAYSSHKHQRHEHAGSGSGGTSAPAAPHHPRSALHAPSSRLRRGHARPDQVAAAGCVLGRAAHGRGWRLERGERA